MTLNRAEDGLWQREHLCWRDTSSIHRSVLGGTWDISLWLSGFVWRVLYLRYLRSALQLASEFRLTLLSDFTTTNIFNRSFQHSLQARRLSVTLRQWQATIMSCRTLNSWVIINGHFCRSTYTSTFVRQQDPASTSFPIPTSQASIFIWWSTPKVRLIWIWWGPLRRYILLVCPIQWFLNQKHTVRSSFGCQILGQVCQSS